MGRVGHSDTNVLAMLVAVREAERPSLTTNVVLETLQITAPCLRVTVVSKALRSPTGERNAALFNYDLKSFDCGNPSARLLGTE